MQRSCHRAEGLRWLKSPPAGCSWPGTTRAPGHTCPTSIYQREDRFTVALPAAPQIETFTYVTEYASKLRARRYTATDGKTDCVMTVVDMSTTDRAPNGHAIEIRGPIQFAATNMRRTGTGSALCREQFILP